MDKTRENMECLRKNAKFKEFAEILDLKNAISKTQ